MANLTFSPGKVLSGTPREVLKILGMGLIPFLAVDGQMYVIDVKGNVQLFTDLIQVGGTSSVLSFVIGEPSYYLNNALIATGSPGENAGGTSVLDLAAWFDGGVIIGYSNGGLQIPQSGFVFNPTGIFTAGIPFNDGDVVIITGGKQASGGGGGGGTVMSIVCDLNIVSTAEQTQFPAIPDADLKKATHTLFFREGALLTAGTGGDEYLNTPQNGYLTTNFVPGDEQRMRIVGFIL